MVTIHFVTSFYLSLHAQSCQLRDQQKEMLLPQKNKFSPNWARGSVEEGGKGSPSVRGVKVPSPPPKPLVQIGVAVQFLSAAVGE